MKALRSLLFKPRLIPSLGVLTVLLYFGHFVLPGLHGRFNNDDPMNLYYYWSRGGWALIQGLVLFFTTYSRPMGGVYFYSLYELFGLNPYPYHVVITLLLLVNVFLANCCARLLSFRTRSRASNSSRTRVMFFSMTASSASRAANFSLAVRHASALPRRARVTSARSSGRRLRTKREQ